MVGFVDRQHIKRAALDLWQSLTRCLESQCEAFDKNSSPRILFASVKDADGKIKEVLLKNAQTEAWINLKFDSRTPLIWFHTPGPNGYFEFKVNDDGSGAMFLNRKHDALFASETADEILKYVLPEAQQETGALGTLDNRELHLSRPCTEKREPCVIIGSRRHFQA